MSFRNETFFEYLKERKMTAPMGLSMTFMVLMGIGVSLLDFSIYSLLIGVGFVLVGFINVFVFSNYTAFKLYKKGGRLVRIYQTDQSELVENLRVYIKSFDIWKAKNKYSIGVKTIYDFQYADLLLNPSSIILLGRGDAVLVEGYAFPVELCIGKSRYSNYAKITQMNELLNGRLEFFIKDPNYTREIKLQFKENEMLRNWVSVNNAILVQEK